MKREDLLGLITLIIISLVVIIIGFMFCLYVLGYYDSSIYCNVSENMNIIGRC